MTLGSIAGFLCQSDALATSPCLRLAAATGTTPSFLRARVYASWRSTFLARRLRSPGLASPQQGSSAETFVPPSRLPRMAPGWSLLVFLFTIFHGTRLLQSFKGSTKYFVLMAYFCAG